METTVKLEYGPMEVEIHAFDDEDYQTEVLDLIQFIEENEEALSGLDGFEEISEMGGSENEEMSLEEFTESEDVGEEEESESGPLHEIAKKLRVPEAKLNEFLHVDPESGDRPVFYTEEIEDLGERKTDRQRVASLVLLYLWHECYDIERVKSTELKDALELSDVTATGMGNMYQGQGDRYFDRKGRGPSATVRLTPPGKREARNLIKKFTQEDGPEQD